MRLSRFTLTLPGIISLFLLGVNPSLAQNNIARPEGWDEYSHGNATAPDYERILPQDKVNTMTITLSPEDWQAMQNDMTKMYGEFGARQGRGGPGFFRPEGGQAPLFGELPEGFEPPEGFELPLFGELPEGFEMPDGGEPPDRMMFGGPGGLFGNDQNPIWVAADIAFEGQIWTNVGFRLKGNSSLMSSWGGGNYKLPFKLDFDEFEDANPEIDNQRFYGFKELSFSSNWSDESLLREKVTADIFREAGVPSAQTAFYAVYVDYGEGPIYFGLYTAVEVVDDTVIKTQFVDDSGNAYKPEGNGATFAEGSFSEEAFDKQTNQDEDDYGDILALFDALHAETRTTDPEAWRAGLESVFDVYGFIRWLATNQLVQNWDTYGQMSHNYYLYNDPTTGLLTWIPWDNNMALSGAGGMIGFGGRVNPGGRAAPANPGGGNPMGGLGGSLSIDLANVDENWPLIRFVMDDPVYHAQYVQDVDDVGKTVFEPARMTAIYQTLHDLISPYVVGENGESESHTFLGSPEAFETALTALITHVNTRYTVAQEYVKAQMVKR